MALKGSLGLLFSLLICTNGSSGLRLVSKPPIIQIFFSTEEKFQFLPFQHSLSKKNCPFLAAQTSVFYLNGSKIINSMY